MTKDGTADPVTSTPILEISSYVLSLLASNSKSKVLFYTIFAKGHSQEPTEVLSPSIASGIFPDLFSRI